MNKALILGLLIAAALVAACVPVAKTYVCADGRQVASPSECQLPTETNDMGGSMEDSKDDRMEDRNRESVPAPAEASFKPFHSRQDSNVIRITPFSV